ANVKVAWKLQEFFNRKWSIPNFDRIVGGIYHWGGFLAFNRLGLLLCIPLIGFGFGRWVTEVGNPANELLKTNGSLLLGLLTYVLIKIFIGFLHELGQALYLKSLRREVPEGGIIWYYGIPYMFHNSNDIWLESRPRRLFHSALGPLVELVIGSLAFVAIYLADVNTWVWDPLVVNTLFKVGMFAFVGAFFKLNPLIELDGYFLLVDIVGVPRLMR